MYCLQYDRGNPKRRALRLAVALSVILVAQGCQRGEIVDDYRTLVVNDSRLNQEIASLRARGFGVALVDTPITDENYWERVYAQRYLIITELHLTV